MKRSLHILPGWLLLCILLVSGYIYEEVEHCGDFETCEVAFNFRYDYNMYYTDRFAEEVDHVSLFIYDAVTQELKLRIDKFRTGMEPEHTITTELPAGEYIAVAWGNCDQQTDHFAITQPGRLSTLQMGLTCIESDNEATVNRIGSVFHALYAFEATEEEPVTVPMSMTKNTNRVRVIIRGLDQMTKEEAEETMKIRVSSDNWLYTYDSRLSTTQMIHYRPEYSSAEEIVADFYILRMQADYENDIFINLQYRDIALGREPVDILPNYPLIPLLIDLENPPVPLPAEDGLKSEDDPYAWANELLDREDEYEIIFEVTIDADGNLYTEPWDGITRPGELGS
ncbi:MAG: FimB/Mfa2 family fimbrial subunit [Bacteroides sp.]|nr:FimB/Mfa2 family fimbrial subunit [Bacteroides sp.]